MLSQIACSSELSIFGTDNGDDYFRVTLMKLTRDCMIIFC